MNYFQISIVTTVCLCLILFPGKHLYQGIRTGRIYHSDSISSVEIKKNPLAFLALVVLYFILIAMSALVWIFIIRENIKQLAVEGL